MVEPAFARCAASDVKQDPKGNGSKQAACSHSLLGTSTSAKSALYTGQTVNPQATGKPEDGAA